MLVLGRMTGEKFIVGDDVEITILAADRGKCRVGITAPQQVKILRSELIETVQTIWGHAEIGGEAGQA